jgi:hypothetical protein
MKFTETGYWHPREAGISTEHFSLNICIDLFSSYEQIVVRWHTSDRYWVPVAGLTCEVGQGEATAAEMIRELRDALTAALEE